LSINRPRRIFRSALPRPEPKVLAAALGVALMAVAGVSLAVLPRSGRSPTPKPGTATEQLSARSEQIAVVDGGTLLFGDRVVRLRGVDPPPHNPACSGEDCGAAAANALAAIIRDTPVACRIAGADGSGRPYGVCQAGGTELNRAVIAGGWARADTNDPALKSAETKARDEKRGIWARYPGW
jgi:endonuclease YncB( thermonuclease family)